jgi:hypothetical protein
VHTPVWTTYPTSELKTPCTKNENLNIEPPLLDGGQGKDIVCNMMHPKNVTVLEDASETPSIGDTVKRGSDKISAPVDWKKPHNPIVFHENMPDANTHLPDHHDNNKKTVVRPNRQNLLGVESGPPPVLALRGQTTKMSPGCTYAPSNKPVDKITSPNSDCANVITTMGGLDPCGTMCQSNKELA